MANDSFRSLLSTFQEATTGEISVEETPKGSLLEATTQLWRLSQLKQSIHTTAPNISKPSAPKQPKFLAVCLCIVDDLPHADIWKHWTDDGKSAELYVHAKHPEKIASGWTKTKLISISHKPNWNDVRIVKAMLSLADEALRDKRVTHVYFGTESCLPICGLEETLEQVENDKSYLSYYGKEQASRYEERECWSPVEQFVPSEAIYKALPGWCILSRSHVQAILDINVQPFQLWQAFLHCWAPDEVYFATCLSLLGLLGDDNVKNKSLVHAEWNTRARGQERAHPKEYDADFGPGLVRYLRQREGCVILRKVKERMSLERWKQAVLVLEQRRDSPRDGREHHYERHRKHPRAPPQDARGYNDARSRSRDKMRRRPPPPQDSRYGHYRRTDHDYHFDRHRRRGIDNQERSYCGDRSEYRHKR